MKYTTGLKAPDRHLYRIVPIFIDGSYVFESQETRTPYSTNISGATPFVAKRTRPKPSSVGAAPTNRGATSLRSIHPQINGLTYSHRAAVISSIEYISGFYWSSKTIPPGDETSRSQFSWNWNNRPNASLHLRILRRTRMIMHAPEGIYDSIPDGGCGYFLHNG